MNLQLTMSITIFLSVCLCFFVRFTNISQSGFCRSLNATARWWFSSTDSSLYMMASSELVLMRNWLVRPGWSTSWIAAANTADITWTQRNIFQYFRNNFDSPREEWRHIPEQESWEEHEWTESHQQRGHCCGREHLNSEIKSLQNEWNLCFSSWLLSMTMSCAICIGNISAKSSTAWEQSCVYLVSNDLLMCGGNWWTPCQEF